VASMVLFGAGLLLYFFGRAYDLRVALLSLVVLTAALLIFAKGAAVLRLAWFPLLFPVFAAPLPLSLVLALTGPLKIAVSAAATALLSALGYDIGRAGVVVTIGQYQLLVTEACAGLQTMFTLEAMGLLYTNLRGHSSWARNGMLAALVVPISFVANVIRVAALALVTLYLGDAAGQGFLYGFAGLLLFGVAIALLLGADCLPGKFAALRAR
jgi:exosortase